MKRFLTRVVLAVLFMSLAACKAERPVTTAPLAAPSAAAVVPNAMIKIVPETPTVTTDLQALVSGKESASYRWEKNGRILDGENTQRLSKSRFVKGDRITASATDAHGTVSTSVTIANSRPQVTSLSVVPQQIYHGVDITAIPVGYDADGDQVGFQYRWSVNGEELSEHGATLRGDQFKKKDVVVLEVIPSDNEGEGDSYHAVPLVIPNAPPRFVSLPPTAFSSDTYLYSARAEDPDGDLLSYTLASSPRGMTVDGKTGQITWQIRKEDAGPHEIEVVVQDDMGLKAFQKYSLVITIPNSSEAQK